MSVWPGGSRSRHVFDRRQSAILSNRYMDCLLGDFSSLVWMIGQAPLIAGLIILRWTSWHSTDSLFFVMALSALWFGCINSCRELARELTIYQRERLFGLNRAAYLASKVKILNLLGLLKLECFFSTQFVLDLDLSIVPAFSHPDGPLFFGIRAGLVSVASPWIRRSSRCGRPHRHPATDHLLQIRAACGVDERRRLHHFEFHDCQMGASGPNIMQKGTNGIAGSSHSVGCVLGLAVACLLFTYLHMLVFESETAGDTA